MFSVLISGGRRCLGLFVLAVLVASPAAVAGFPEAAQLPSQAGLPDPLVMLDGHRVTEQGAVGRRAPARAEGAVPALHVRRDAPRADEDRRDRRAGGPPTTSAARRP